MKRLINSKTPVGACIVNSVFALLVALCTAPGVARAQEACCFPDGMCEELMVADCANAGGTARGGGTTCDTVICPASDLCSSPTLAIPDNDPMGIDDTIVVAGDVALVDVDVYLRIDHTWIGDLIITLTHEESMTSAVIYDRPRSPPGTGCDQDNVEVILDDEADMSVEEVCELSTPTQFGIFMPAEALTIFNGESSGGTWTLNVSDNAGFDTGTLIQWCLILKTDSDGDGVADEDDICPGSDDAVDTDGDAVPDGCDACFGDDAVGDADGDGECDDLDDCPNDPNKTRPGACGCGNADDDSDGDNVPDCFDSCPNDVNKIAPGVCGCGDADDDGDGLCDTLDDCPDDPNKTSPGACGCGNADNDSDGDNVPDCFDQCPNDANKIAPGICGCGNADVDSDNDGRLDCVDNCPNEPNADQADEDGDGMGDACSSPPVGQANPCAPQAMIMPMLAVSLLMFVQRRRRRRVKNTHQHRTSLTSGNGLMLLTVFASSTAVFAQPENDECSAAIGPLAVPSNTMGNTSMATVDTDFAMLPTCGTSITAPGIWYTVIGTGNTMTATTCDGGAITDYDTKLHVFCSCNAMICVGGNDAQVGRTVPECVVTDIPFNLGSTISWCSEPGATYMILVSGIATETGNFDLSISDDGVECGLPTVACDADADGVTNEDDNCPNTPNADQENNDGDEFGDACDNAPQDDNPNQADGDGDGVGDVADACPGADDAADADGDGLCDALDDCPDDPDKTSPGACGCGNADDDSDGDTVPDCFDGCPNDVNKVAPDICGCGNADADGDGVCDTLDDCPNDPQKTSPGACGCGNADDDSDGDNVPDCFDQCPNDAGKIAPDICGCGTSDVDSDNDGWLECFDNCPNTPNGDQADGDGDGMGDACSPAPVVQENPCAPMGMMMMTMTPLMLLGLRRRRRRSSN